MSEGGRRFGMQRCWLGVVGLGFTACFPPPHLPDTQDSTGGDNTEVLDSAQSTAMPDSVEFSDTAVVAVDSDPLDLDTYLSETETADETSDIAPDTTTPPECHVDGDCDDHRACNGPERCADGTCVDGVPLVCTPPTEPCKTGRCDEAHGCVVEDAPDGSSCDDDALCTSTSACKAGLCEARTDVICEPPNDCQEAGACDPLSGVCVYTATDDGVPCVTTAAEEGTCKAGSCARLPILIAGGHHVCAILYDGSMHCWGANESGQLGLGHTDPVGGATGRSVHDESKVSIEPVTGGLAGPAHTCAWGASGMRCWGANQYGSLGYADDLRRGDTPQTTPDLIETVPLGALPTMGVGPFVHSCVVTDTGGVRCWGMGLFACHLGCIYYGDLGQPGLLLIGGEGNTPPAVAGDVELSTDGSFHAAAVATGLRHSCALSTVGDVRCWGSADALGFVGTTNIGYLAPPSTAALANVAWSASAIGAGRGHTCAVTTTRELYCWGNPDVPAALGLGSSDPQPVPAKVDVGFEVAALALGWDHTCALSRFGSVKCWGTNAGGQLGSQSGTGAIGATAQTVPLGIPIANTGGPVSALAAGGTYTCAVMRSGAIRCWGTGPLGRADDAVIGDGIGDMPPDDVPIGP